MEDEVWKVIRDFSQYEVSNRGRVKKILSLFGPGPKKLPNFLKLNVGANGYLRVHLSHGEVHKMKKVHSLVLEAFCGPRPFVGAVARHVDGSKDNNQIGNLVWGTQKENVDDRERHGRTPCGARNGRALLTPSDVTSIRSLKLPYGGQSRLAKEMGVSVSAINRIVMGKSWSRLGG